MTRMTDFLKLIMTLQMNLMEIKNIFETNQW